MNNSIIGRSRIAFAAPIILAFSAISFAQSPITEVVAEPDKTAVTQVARLEPVEVSRTQNVNESADVAPIVPSLIRNSPTIRIGIDPSQTRPLTLNQAIRLALENNNTIEIAKDDVQIAESGLKAIEGAYDPVLSFSPAYSKQIQPQPTTLGGADLSGVTRSDSLKVDANFIQPVKFWGGQFNSFFSNGRNNTSSSFSQLNPTYNSNLGFSYAQPLWRNRSIDQTRRQIKIQQKVISQSDADFRRTTIDIISQVQRSYWDLVFALRDQQNRIANLALSKENLRQIDAKIQAGAAAPLERAEIQTELANRESDLLIATQSVSIAENTLKLLILKDTSSPEWSDNLIPTDQPVFSNDPIDLTAVTADAINNRPELVRLKLQSEMNSIDLDFYKNQMKPQIDLNVNYTMIGLSGDPTSAGGTVTAPLISGNPNTNPDAFLLSQLQILNPAITVPNVTVTNSVGVPSQFIGGDGQSLKNMFSNDTRTFSIGATISFPLRNRTAKANLATSEIRANQIEAQTRSQEQIVIVEVRNAVQSVETARQRVVTSRIARTNAEIQLEGERKLYASGRSTSFLLFQRENALTNARNAEIRAETDYNKSLADLQKATSTTISANNIVIQDPSDDN